jgi:hypothetical protein
MFQISSRRPDAPTEKGTADRERIALLAPAKRIGDCSDIVVRYFEKLLGPQFWLKILIQHAFVVVLGPLLPAFERLFVKIVRGSKVIRSALVGSSVRSLRASLRASASETTGYCPMFVRSRSRPRTTNQVFRFFRREGRTQVSSRHSTCRSLGPRDNNVDHVELWHFCSDFAAPW